MERLNEELQQIQEKGLESNREARIRSLPSAEDIIKELEII